MANDVFEWDVLVRGRLPTHAEFEAACLIPNRPGIVRGYAAAVAAASGAVDPCRNVLQVLSRLAEQAPLTAVAPVVWQSSTNRPRSSCPDAAQGEPNDAPHSSVCSTTPLREFLNRPAILRAIRSADIAAGSNESTEGHRAAYLKDWHLCQELADPDGPLNHSHFSFDSEAVHGSDVALSLYGGHPPFLGRHDWLNDLCDDRSRHRGHGTNATESGASLGGGAGEDYRFCYIGDAGTWTPLHVDVYGSYSWSLNVVGSKEWFFARRDDFDRHWVAFLSRPGTPGQTMPPDIRCTTFDFVHVTQRAGDLVFVPSMYLHQVHNDAGAAISVNHNWCAEWNATLMYKALAAECDSIGSMVDADAVALFKADGEWKELRDRMLMGSGGWSVAAFADYLRRARCRRLHPNCSSDDDGADAKQESYVQLIDDLLAELDRL